MFKATKNIYFAILLFLTDYFSSVKRITIAKAKKLKIRDTQQTKIRNGFINHPFRPFIIIGLVIAVVHIKVWNYISIPKPSIELNQSFYIMFHGILGVILGLIAFIIVAIVIGILYLLIAAFFEKD